jgi:hypothetical protein
VIQEPYLQLLCFGRILHVPYLTSSQGDYKMTTNMISGTAFFSGSETFLRDLTPEDELMITGGRGKKCKYSTSKSKSKSKSCS